MKPLILTEILARVNSLLIILLLLREMGSLAAPVVCIFFLKLIVKAKKYFCSLPLLPQWNEFFSTIARCHFGINSSVVLWPTNAILGSLLYQSTKLSAFPSHCICTFYPRANLDSGADFMDEFSVRVNFNSFECSFIFFRSPWKYNGRLLADGLDYRCFHHNNAHQVSPIWHFCASFVCPVMSD